MVEIENICRLCMAEADPKENDLSNIFETKTEDDLPLSILDRIILVANIKVIMRANRITKNSQ